MEIGLNRAADAAEISTSATLFHAINTADTLKLVLLAVAIAAAACIAADRQAFPRWVRGLGYATAPALVIGGAAFIVTPDALSAVLALSLLLPSSCDGVSDPMYPRRGPGNVHGAHAPANAELRCGRVAGEDAHGARVATVSGDGKSR
jgi:hypothetical protein